MAVAWKPPSSPRSTQKHTDLATSPRSGSGSPHGKTRHSATKLAKSDAHAETADLNYQEATSGAMSPAPETPQPGSTTAGSDAKRHLSSGHEGEVLELVQKYLPPELAEAYRPPEDKHLMQQQETAEKGSWGSIDNISSPLSTQAADSTSQQTTTPQVNTTSAAAALDATFPSQQPFAASQPTTGATSPTATAGSPLTIRPLSSTLLPAVGTSGIISSDVLSVLGAWYAMYCPAREAQLQAALMAHYDPHARFDDNFMQVFGREQIGVQFYAARRAVDSIDLHIEKVEVLNGSEQTTTAAGANIFAGILSTFINKPQNGTYQLRIISRIAFYLPAFIRGPLTSWFLPPAVDVWATDILTVRQSDNKVVHHQQRVHNIPVTPWPLRAWVGLSTSVFLMHVMGW